MRIDLNDLTFGIEIETTIASAAMLSRNWTVGAYHVGADIPGFPGWKTMHDGSIQARYPNVGVEVVSPVLRGVDGIAQVERMVETLRAMGASVNRSTGFHVHVGWNGTTEQLRRLVCFVAFHETAFLASTGTHARDNNRFCSSIRQQYRPLETSQTMQEAGYFSRYHVLNLQNLQRPAVKRTVEFRVFAGTLNIVKILAYIQLCLGSVQKALENPRKALPFDVPASERQARLHVGAGTWAMRVLLTHLHWRKQPRPGRASAGVLVPERVPAMLTQLLKMAKQYDARGSR